MFNSKQKKYWFTLAETVIVCTMFAFVVVWVVLAINRSFVFLDNTRIMVRASNFAREWIEMVYNMRDTNRKRNSWEKDLYWNSRWERNCTTNSECFLNPWVYAIKDETTPDWDTYFYAKKLNVPASQVDVFYEDKFFSDEYTSIIADAKLEFTWTYQYYTWNRMEYWSLESLLSNGWVQFYRVLRVYGIYCKNTTDVSLDSSACADKANPKELRFCVKVYFRSRWAQDVELCSIMTNFEK